jgi:aminoglycoside phosphotransferase (APT) family kinase protein
VLVADGHPVHHLAGPPGRREGDLQRELRRWQRQLEQSRTRELPVLDKVHRRLGGDVTEQVGPAPVVHGDYRLGNVVVSPAGRVRVGLDWELCTLGDPLAAVVTATAGSSIMASRPPP